MSLLLPLTLALGAAAPSDGLLAIRVRRAETATAGPVEHAVILVEDGKIAAIGEDLPVERGIPILDRPDWIVIPGLVDAYSRLGLDGEGGDDNSPDAHAFGELYPRAEEYAKVLEYGVTTLGLYPPGNALAGQAVAVRPAGKTAESMRLRDPTYLKVVLRAASSSKKLVTDGFRKADEHLEKVEKAREKWEKEQESKKKKSASKKDDKKDDKKDEKKDEKKEEGKDEDKSPSGEDKKDETSGGEKDEFTPPEPDSKVQPFLDLRSGDLHALVSVSGAAEYLHLLDALGKESIDFDLRVPLSRYCDIFYVLDKETYELDVDGIGDRECRVVVEPALTYHPGTMRSRNLPMELARAGAKVVFIPRRDELPSFRDWLADVGEVVAAGLDRAAALRAMTSEPAALLGVADELGSLEKGKAANLVFLSGEPFEPSTRIEAVMLDGQFVHGDVNR